MINELRDARWFKSSRSNGQNNCVEVANNLPDVVLVRDSKDRDGSILTFAPAAWQAFVGRVRQA